MSPTPSPVLDGLRLAFFLPFLVFMLVLASILFVNTMAKSTSHYFLRVRFPSIVLCELVQTSLSVTVICLSEVYRALGRPFPCSVVNFATISMPVSGA